MEKKQIVFLYSEIATYFTACIEKLAMHEQVAVTVIRWPLNKEAPFNFRYSSSVSFHNRDEFANDRDLFRFIDQLDPAVLYCSGWMDQGYLRVCKKYKNKIPVIVGMDNQWAGSFKQQIARLLSPFRLLNHFSHCWVPGILQEQFALKLGFSEDKILTGFYSCDFDFFNAQYLANKLAKKDHFPQRFIYVGRYSATKGVQMLWSAFIELQQENPSDWELWCLGTGDIEPVIHPKIKHCGFIQPLELPEYIKKTGVFVLPSLFEPWGVVVHEFAAAGFPIICSDKVGARTAFVENEFNGYIYKAGDKAGLKTVLSLMMHSGPGRLMEMGDRSVEKAKTITPEKWAQKLMTLVR